MENFWINFAISAWVAGISFSVGYLISNYINKCAHQAAQDLIDASERLIKSLKEENKWYKDKHEIFAAVFYRLSCFPDKRDKLLEAIKKRHQELHPDDMDEDEKLIEEKKQMGKWTSWAKKH